MDETRPDLQATCKKSGRDDENLKNWRARQGSNL